MKQGQAKLPFLKGSLEAGFNLEKLLTGDVNRLRYIVRYGTAFTLHKENVAEHSYYVGFYALFIYHWAKETSNWPLDLGKLLEACILHDLEECRTGDFPRPFKYKRAALKQQLDVVATEEFQELMEELLPGETPALDHLLFSWETAKDTSHPEGCILALADFLAVLSFLMSETAIGNPSIGIHDGTMVEYSQSFNDSDFDFLRPLVQMAQAVTLEVFSR